MGEFDDADETYRQALRGYQDVSPFPVAWVCFQLGMLWGELVPEPQLARAEQLVSKGDRQFAVLCEGARASGGNLFERRADRATRRRCSCRRSPAAIRRCSGGWLTCWPPGRHDEADAHMEAARSGFEALLGQALAGIRRSWRGVLIRQRKRCPQGAGTGADQSRESPDAARLRADLHDRPRSRRDRCGRRNSPGSRQRPGRRSRVSLVTAGGVVADRAPPGSFERSSRMMIDRRTFVVGAGLAALTPAWASSLPQLPAAATSASPPVFMITGWSSEGDNGSDGQVWITVGHGWRTAWR